MPDAAGLSLTSGARLGPYEIVAPLGAGGMGEVYKARDTRLDRIVAVKILRAGVAGEPQRRERFRREARAISSLAHPHICALHDVGAANGIDFLVLEYLHGETLAHRLLRGPLKFADAIRTAVQIADALDKAHRAGVVHRDLKPGNVMMTADGVKLLDFGLAALRQFGPAFAAASTVSLEPPTPLTGSGAILGTLHYLSPEQLDGKDADARSDIWAWGCVAYELFTGRRPFQGDSQAQVIAAILNTEPPPVSAMQPLASHAVDGIVAKSLSKEADRRWQSAGDMRDAFDLAASTHPTDTASPGRAAWPAWIAWIVAAAAVIGLAAILWSSRFAAPGGQAGGEMRFQIAAVPTVDIFSIALSPDGRSLAYVSSRDSRSQLWLRKLAATDGILMAGTDGAAFPFWSADSRSIAFFANGKLKRVDVDGGQVITLADAYQGRGGAWNKDDVIIFTPSAQSPLYRVAATGGQPVELTHLESQVGSHRFPRFLPDGRHFVFFAFSSSRDKQGIYLATVDSPSARRLFYADSTAVFAPPETLVFERQHVLLTVRLDLNTLQAVGEPSPLNEQIAESVLNTLALSVTGNTLAYCDPASAARPELAWFDRAGTRLGVTGNGDAIAANPELYADGIRILFERDVDASHEVWLLDSANAAPRRLTYDTGYAPVWSPDGERFVFSRVPSIYFDLFVKRLGDAAPPRLILESDTQKYATDWSRDGRFILFNNVDQANGYDIVALPLDGGGKPFPVANTRFEERQGRFAPNGRWIAYQSNESGRFEVYVQPFSGPGARVRISAAGGIQPRWRGDGRELFYLAPDGTLMAVSLQQASEGDRLEIRSATPLFQTHVPEVHGAGRGGASNFDYAVSPDASKFLINEDQTQNRGGPITIVLNWRATAK